MTTVSSQYCRAKQLWGKGVFATISFSTPLDINTLEFLA